MKKTLTILAVALFVLASCATTSTATGGADLLDPAIREASDYLNTKIPAGNKVAFINISGGYPDLSDYILSDLAKNGVNDGKFSVVDRAQLEAVRAELQFNMSGEVSDSSAQAIGQMLGAQTIVTGGVRKIGSMYRLDVKAIEVQTATVQGAWNKNIPDGMTITELTKNTSGGAVTATASASGSKPSGTTAAAAPATPTATYKIGDTGPAGGIIFYDKGNSTGGWRYLEAAPANTEIVSVWVAPITLLTRTNGALREIIPYGINNRKSKVGDGKINTQDIVKIAQNNGGGFGWAAVECASLSASDFNDWFLPSSDELNFMYGNLHRKGLGEFRNEKYYSSTADTNGSRIMVINFSDGKLIEDYPYDSTKYRVRAVRQF